MKYQLEVRVGQDIRAIDADKWMESEGWFIFFVAPPTGGMREVFRIQSADVISLRPER